MAQHDALTVATVADHQPRMQPQRRALECDRGGQRVAGPRRGVYPRAAQRQRRAPAVAAQHDPERTTAAGRCREAPGTGARQSKPCASSSPRTLTAGGSLPAPARRRGRAPAGRAVDGRRAASAAASPQLPMLTALPLNRPPGTGSRICPRSSMSAATVPQIRPVSGSSPQELAAPRGGSTVSKPRFRSHR